MIINNKFEIGQVVYLKADKEQSEFIITAIIVNANSHLYSLRNLDNEIDVFEFEISDERDVLKCI